jgi:hypothetical protein
VQFDARRRFYLGPRLPGCAKNGRDGAELITKQAVCAPS